MISKDLKKLNRRELVDVIYQLKKNEEQMQEKIASLEAELQDRRIHISSAGSIADAAMDITSLFSHAQATADLYLNEISSLKEDAQRECDKVTVFTYKLVINKTDSHGHELEGAGFTLYKKNLSGEYIALGAELAGDGMTTFTWVGLDDGDYKLVETTVPEGYNKMSDVLFSVSAEHSEIAGEPSLTLLNGGLMGEGNVATGSIEKDIVNNTGTILPETGAEGTFMMIFGGSLLVILAAVFMITRKKMSVYED